MAVADFTLTDLTYAEVRAELRQAIADGDRPAAERIASAYSGLAAEAIAAGEPGAMTKLRVRAARLARNVDGDAELHGWFASIDKTLEAGRTAALMRAANEAREREASVLPQRIVELLKDGPRRPRELAELLEVDPSQVSRALRGLLDDAHVV